MLGIGIGIRIRLTWLAVASTKVEYGLCENIRSMD